MTEAFEIFLTPAIVFILCVCPLWLALHYAKIYRSQRFLTHEEHIELERLRDAAEKMSDRIDTLESILEDPEGTSRSEADSQTNGGNNER